MKTSTHGRIMYVCRAGVVAALYVVLTLLSAVFGLSGGAIQLRLSEALCILPLFFPSAVPGLTVGCFLANFLTGCLWQDVLFGTFATFLGALGARLLRGTHPILATLPTVLANTLTLPFVLAYVYHAEGTLWFFFLTVGIGELLSAGLFGSLLAFYLQKYAGSKLGLFESVSKERTQKLRLSLPAPVSEAMRVLEDAGFEIYAVGGCVRDSLLGKTPKDWDLTTNALPEEMLQIFSSYKVIETGIKHGTLTVLIDSTPLEITTYRFDGDYADHRHPVKVRFSKSLAEDLARRDFTVNAMAYHPSVGLVDLFGGQKHLKEKRICCVGEPATRFDEDGLRILRALRFAAVLGFDLDPATARAVHNCKSLLENIAYERIREEFSKLLCGENAVPVLREFSDVVFFIFPELAPTFGFDQKCKYHCFDVWEHTLHAIQNAKRELSIRWALLFHDCGKPAVCVEDSEGRHFPKHAEQSVLLADTALSRLRFDNKTREEILVLIELHDRPLSAEEKPLKRLLQRVDFETVLKLTEIQNADRLACAPAFSKTDAELDKIPEVLEKIKAEGACLSLKTLAVNGSDLLSVGIPAGKEIGKALQRLLEKVVDGELPNEKGALLNFLKESR